MVPGPRAHLREERQDGGGGAHGLGFQRVGREVCPLRSRQPHPGQDRPLARPSPVRAEDGARGRVDRGERQGAAPGHRVVPPQQESESRAHPGADRAQPRGRPGGAHHPVAGRRDPRGRHGRARRRPDPVLQRERNRDLSRARPPRPEPRRARAEPRAPARPAHAVRGPVQDHGAGDARAPAIPRAEAARDLRELPRHKRGRPPALVPPAPPRPRGGRGARILLPRPRGRPNRLLGTRGGPRHSTLYLATTARAHSMKILPAITVCCAAALLAGCESGIEDTVRSAIAPREAPRSRVFQADQKAAYAAALAAADQMGYRFVRGGLAEGRLEELSGISSGDDTGSSRQISMRVRLSPDEEAGTAVSVAFNEIIESDSKNLPGVATETPMRDSALYEVFFRNLQQALQAPPKQ